MQTDDITIPPEAVEAAARELAPHPWSMYTDSAQAHFQAKATAAIRAALAAWPGMHTHEWQRPWLGGMSGTDIILPLNTENADG